MGTHSASKRRPNHRLVKIHRSYTVAEAAKLLGGSTERNSAMGRKRLADD